MQSRSRKSLTVCSRRLFSSGVFLLILFLSSCTSADFRNQAYFETLRSTETLEFKQLPEACDYYVMIKPSSSRELLALFLESDNTLDSFIERTDFLYAAVSTSEIDPEMLVFAKGAYPASLISFSLRLNRSYESIGSAWFRHRHDGSEIYIMNKNQIIFSTGSLHEAFLGLASEQKLFIDLEHPFSYNEYDVFFASGETAVQRTILGNILSSKLYMQNRGDQYEVSGQFVFDNALAASLSVPVLRLLFLEQNRINFREAVENFSVAAKGNEIIFEGFLASFEFIHKNFIGEGL